GGFGGGGGAGRGGGGRTIGPGPPPRLAALADGPHRLHARRRCGRMGGGIGRLRRPARRHGPHGAARREDRPRQDARPPDRAGDHQAHAAPRLRLCADPVRRRAAGAQQRRPRAAHGRHGAPRRRPRGVRRALAGPIARRIANLCLNAAASSAVKVFDSNLRTGTAMDYISGHDAMSGARTWIVALAWVGLALLLIFGRSSSPRDATTLMEYLADRADRAVAIHPLTAQEIERLMRQPAYDCRQVTCDHPLPIPNRLLRPP